MIIYSCSFSLCLTMNSPMFHVHYSYNGPKGYYFEVYQPAGVLINSGWQEIRPSVLTAIACIPRDKIYVDDKEQSGK
jgi:hypothetical protein